MPRHPSDPREIAWGEWVGSQVRAAREGRGLSRNDLSRIAECSPQNLAKVEDGKSPSIGFLMLGRIASHLSLELDSLFARFNRNAGGRE